MAGKCIIVSAPSGAGKTSIVRHLLKAFPLLSFSVSATSRPPRLDERHGTDYYFIGADEFRARIEAGDFLEWQEVYPGRYYGTLLSEIERIWSEGHHVIFDLDVVGGCNLKKYFGDKALGIFVQPPDMEALRVRLQARATESEESMRQRLDKAAFELTFADRFDLVLVNDHFEHACAVASNAVKSFLGV